MFFSVGVKYEMYIFILIKCLIFNTCFSGLLSVQNGCLMSLLDFLQNDRREVRRHKNPNEIG